MRKRLVEEQHIEGRRLLNIMEASAYIGQGRNSARRYFDEIGATRKFGRRVLFDRKVIDNALDKMMEDQAI